MLKCGIVVEGGGMKSAYSAGILDYLLDEKITFDYCIGVSAGAANLASFLGGQRERNLRFYVIHSKDPRYLGVRNLLTHGSMFNLSFIYQTMTNSTGADPLNYPALRDNPAEYYVVATDAHTGKPVYFDKSYFRQDDYRALMSSCAIPAFCRPISFRGGLYFDGGASDSIPVKRALADGCDRLLILLSKPRGYVKQPEKGRPAYTILLRKYPAMIRLLNNRHMEYQKQLQFACDLEAQGKAVILAPSKPMPATTFSKDPAMLQSLYDLGYEDGRRELPRWLSMIGQA